MIFANSKLGKHYPTCFIFYIEMVLRIFLLYSPTAWYIAWSGMKYWNYFVLFLLYDRFGVESAPAIVFLKDPGVKPVVHHGLSLHHTTWEPFDFAFAFCLTDSAFCVAGSVNNSMFLNMVENNKQQGRSRFMV